MHKSHDPSTDSDLFVEQHSNALNGISFAICAGGGIAAIEVPKVARELRRYGAKVKIFATEAALQFVGRQALEWASAHEITTQNSGLAEHICQHDGLLVFPATTDLIGKAAHGICPDVCSTLIQSALGKCIPIFFLPTMHDSLRKSPLFEKNVESLSTLRNVFFLEPRIEEGKYKSPPATHIALEITHRIRKLILKEKCQVAPRALVTLGGTVSRIDMARTIANLSTGTLGALVIRRLLENGVEVTALCANHSAQVVECSGLTKIDCPEFEEMKNHLSTACVEENLLGLFHLAAVSDFGNQSTSDEKISSANDELVLTLKKLPKLISMRSLQKISFKVACKLTSSQSDECLEKARFLLKTYNLNAVLWNWGDAAFGRHSSNEAIVIGSDASFHRIQGKEKIALYLVEKFLNQIIY